MGALVGQGVDSLPGMVREGCALGVRWPGLLFGGVVATRDFGQSMRSGDDPA